MDQERVSKRLYVGGLGHTVSKAELEERFGKFGRVLDAEIITRKDDQGNPMKTFAYVSVSISDADLRKCMSVLNKTKWKGGTLQIEPAKESFLHRLAMEREEAKLQKEKPQRNNQTCLLESLKKTGIVDFHMKAVPGTEVPEHKWVVGKFGRVLPVLHLRNQQKNKIVKYDPSKYCHNLRKLEPDLAQAAPVSQLTWHLEGRGDSAHGKRPAESPGMKKPPKKLRQLGREAPRGAAVVSSGCHPNHTSSARLGHRAKPKASEEPELPPSRSLDSKTPGRGLLSDQSSVNGVAAQSSTSGSDSEVDSEEEIRAMVKKEMEKQQARNVEMESDPLEVVGDDFGLKYSSHWSLSNPDAMKKAIKGSCKETVEHDNGYDSADTDEIIAESKTPDPNSSKTTTSEDSKQLEVKNKEKLANKKSSLVNDSSLKTRNVKEEHTERKGKTKKSKTAASQSSAETSDSESSDSESEQGESEISSDYESMMQNCYRLDLSLDDLRALAAKSTGTPAEESDGAQSSGLSSAEENPKGSVNKPKLSNFHPAVKKKGICPEDVLADILAGEENDESSKGENNSRLKYRPFRGMGSLCVKEATKDSTGLKKGSVGSLGLGACASYSGEESSKRQPRNHPLCSPEASSKERQNVPCEQHEALSGAASSAEQRHHPVPRPHSQGKNKGGSSLQAQSSEQGAAHASPAQSDSGSSDGDTNAAGAQKQVKRQQKSPKLLSKKLKRNASNKNAECEASECENGKASLLEEKELYVRAAASKEPTTDKQVQDNQRRLAALEERHRERELQKKLIKGALSKLDSQAAGRHKHIVFDSDVEDEAAVGETLKKDASLGNMHGQDKSAPKPSGKLFDSSEDEQDETDEERFKIKPQFEGKAGEKLLRLQSRFGTDERFRMDARFLESDSEEEAETKSLKADEEDELAAEKKKNLQILGSLLNINLEQPKPNKTATSAKKFKDINALRYDPTREDHAVFEKKPSAAEKESKVKRKKKKEESEKPPQVSEKIYYDIAADLKDLFGSSKNKSEKKEEIPWDKDDAEDSASPDPLGPACGNDAAEELGGFKFSFFGDTEKSSVKEEPYVLETIKPVKVTWQEDPRFQDSSSEGDDEPEASEGEKDQEMFISLPHRESTRFFFFSKDDERLREGPKLFCRSVDLSEEKDGWEDRRRLLLEECRKKHKDAKRKVKVKQ
ncbi:nucleolar protein 8 isoform X3 [Empidonax traillii]|uniref:nucleolar protein 8 isoform X3 n=1 Tax=Empidonax traillii TaxID=164674 RepID=UPI000FFCFBE7|nr:nucleolar protein 8 isoform X3 [Empidonax traillii]